MCISTHFLTFKFLPGSKRVKSIHIHCWKVKRKSIVEPWRCCSLTLIYSVIIGRTFSLPTDCTIYIQLKKDDIFHSNCCDVNFVKYIEMVHRFRIDQKWFPYQKMFCSGKNVCFCHYIVKSLNHDPMPYVSKYWPTQVCQKKNRVGIAVLREGAKILTVLQRVK